MFELAQLWPQFLRPWALLLVLPALGLYGLSQWPGRRASAWAKLIKPEYLTQLSIEQPGNSWLNPARLSLVCSLVWVLALAGPSWRQQQTPLSESQQALVLVLQLNDSMLATDLAPSRLQQAKLKALALLREQPAAAVALVVFAGSSHTVLPLTKDQQTLEKYLLDLQPHIMPAPGYRPELALGQAQALLKAYAGGGGSIVFMADGEGSLVQSHSGEQKLQPIYWRFNATDKAGPSYFSEAGFKQVQASADEDDLKEINWLLSRHWRAAAEAQGAKPRDDGYWLLLPLMLLMLLWFRRGMVLLINQ